MNAEFWKQKQAGRLLRNSPQGLWSLLY